MPPPSNLPAELPAELGTLTAFRAAFESGLARMLASHHDLGAFILVLANAAMDPKLRAHLQPALVERFAALVADPPAAAPDDVVVFEALRELGWEGITTVEGRAAGAFELQVNRLRGLRPLRVAGQRVEALRKPFNPDGFHFAKPFLRKEIFWDGRLLGHDVALLYNKFPFLPLHGLLVPDIHAGLPQFLDETWHRYVWRLVGSLAEGLPGIGFGYNAYGANGSVNHLHFQMFVRPEPLPVADPRWRHNGGTGEYPSGCERHDDVDTAWQAIAARHAANQTYNLIYLPGRMYCLPRRFQGTHPVSDWNGGYAFYEMAGGLTIFTAEHYAGLGAADLEAELGRMRLPG